MNITFLIIKTLSLFELLNMDEKKIEEFRGQEVELCGFYDLVGDHDSLLALEPHIKSCCKSKRAVVIQGRPFQEASSSPVKVRGVLLIEGGKIELLWK